MLKGVYDESQTESNDAELPYYPGAVDPYLFCRASRACSVTFVFEVTGVDYHVDLL